MVPNLIDSSGKTVRQRYTQALELWGDQYAAGGDFCSAVPKYEASLQVTNSQAMEEKLGAARTGCENQPPATENAAANCIRNDSSPSRNHTHAVNTVRKQVRSGPVLFDCLRHQIVGERASDLYWDNFSNRQGILHDYQAINFGSITVRAPHRHPFIFPFHKNLNLLPDPALISS